MHAWRQHIRSTAARRWVVLLLVVAAVVAIAARGASAAPQVLGLQATLEPLPMQCDEQGCSAHLSSFCLQRERPSPHYGARYRPAEADMVVLLVTRADGSVERRGADDLSFAAYRDFAAVRASIPAAAVRALDAVALAVEVGADAALLPEALAGDPDPQTPAEQDLAAGPIREAAGAMFGPGNAELGALQLVNVMINALPDRGRRFNEPPTPVWRNAITGRLAHAAGADAVALARVTYERCQVFDMRRCLEARHRHLVQRLNGRFWDEAPGY